MPIALGNELYLQTRHAFLQLHLLRSDIDYDDRLSTESKFDLIIVTTNVDLDWDSYINTLSPGGKLHIVVAVDRIKATVFPFISEERSMGGSPTGSPAVIFENDRVLPTSSYQTSYRRISIV